VEDAWLLPLKSQATFYNKVPLQDMLQHLATSTAGLEATDILTLFMEMQSWWEEDPCVPEYINRLEDDHERMACRHCLQVPPLSWILHSSKASVGRQAPSHQNLKLWACETQLTIEREQRDTGARGNTFGSASTAIEYHRPSSSSAGFAGGALRTSPPSFEDQFASGLDALALAATNEKAVLDNLVASNKALSELTAKKFNHLEQLLSSRGASPGAALSPNDAKLIAQLCAAITGKWSVAADHTSATCKNKKPGHVYTATRAAPAGHGHKKHINKGWDAFLSNKAPK
jgi:hypothetical protein